MGIKGYVISNNYKSIVCMHGIKFSRVTGIYNINTRQQNIGLNLIFIVYNNNKKETPRDNADMSNEKAETASPKAYGIKKLRSLSKSIAK